MNWFYIIVNGLVLYTLARWVIRREPTASLHWHGVVSLALKCIAGLALGWVYIYYYQTGDTLVFHEEAIALVEFGKTNPGEYVSYILGFVDIPIETRFERMPRVLYQAKLVSIIHWVTGSNYWISSLYFSFFSWWGMWAISAKIARNYPRQSAAALFAGLYIPSLIFWSAGVTKESVAIGAFGFILAILVRPTRVRVLETIGLLVCVFLMWKIKYFYTVPFVFCLGLIYLWDKVIPGWHWWAKIAILPALGCLLFLGVALLNPNFAWDYFPEMVYMNHQAFIEKSSPGTYAHYPMMCPEWKCMIVNFPLAVIAALFRPGLWESSNIFQWVIAAQNFFFLFFSVDYFRRVRRIKLYNQGIQHRVVVGWIFVLSLAGFMGLAAPNFGTLQRYCVIILPVWVFLITSDSDLFKALVARISRIRLPLQHG